MSSWAARAKLHLSQKGQRISAISDKTPLMALMAPHLGALCEKRDSANDGDLVLKVEVMQSEQPQVQPIAEVLTSLKVDSDRNCLPYTEAMNGSEIDTNTARLARFTGKGVIHGDAEQLADKLVTRNRDLDDRRLCLECSHLSGHAGSWRCRNWKLAGIAILARDAGLPSDLVRMLQRCDGFAGTTYKTNLIRGHFHDLQT
jgi:hypothetical protein